MLFRSLLSHSSAPPPPSPDGGIAAKKYEPIGKAELFRTSSGRAARLAYFLASIIFLLAISFPIFAATLSDYKGRIEAAKANVGMLIEDLDSGKQVDEAVRLSVVEKSIPTLETIEWNGGSVETDNAWLANRIAAVIDESDGDNRIEILNEISERLVGISDAVSDLETAVEAGPSKDEAKQKLAEILRREEFQKPQAQEKSLFQQWIDAFLEWLASIFPKPDIAPETATSAASSFNVILQVIIYALVIGIVGFLIYRFGGGVLERLGWKTDETREDRVIFGERVAGTQSAADLFSEAEQMARDGDLRGAIRKGYVALLWELERRKVLRIRDHKTNRDYLSDVRKHATLFGHMRGLTLNFERNWYGLRRGEPADWEAFRSEYNAALSSAVSKT